jgi:hypothetical protein
VAALCTTFTDILSAISLAELEAYGKRADEIYAFTHELIKSVKAEGPV